MHVARRDDESDMADRLRVCFFWLFTAGIIAGLWMYADARSSMAASPATLPPPPRSPASQPVRIAPWYTKVAPQETVTRSELGEVHYSD